MFHRRQARKISALKGHQRRRDKEDGTKKKGIATTKSYQIKKKGPEAPFLVDY